MRTTKTNVRQRRFTLFLVFLAACAVTHAEAANLILNGDFSAGNTGFSTGYSLGLSETEGTYGVFTSGDNTGFF